MTRTPIDPALIHDRGDDGLDALVASLTTAFEPFARAAILDVTAETLADVFLEPAGVLVADQPGVARHELESEMRAELPTVDDAVVRVRAGELARALVPTWIASLADAMVSGSEHALLDGMFADESARTRFEASARDEGIRDVKALAHALHRSLFAQHHTRVLPGGLVMETRGEETIVRAADAHDTVGIDVAQSGARAKDGVVIAPERAKGRR